MPRAEEVQLDWHVLLFALAASLGSGLLFGLAPALRAPARELEQTLRAGARTLAGSSRRMHSGFVISEIALAVVLLISAGMLGRALLRLSSLNPGVNIHDLLTTRIALSPAILANTGQIRAAWQQVLDRAQSLPEVQSVALADIVPMGEGENSSELLGHTRSAATQPGATGPGIVRNAGLSESHGHSAASWPIFQ